MDDFERVFDQSEPAPMEAVAEPVVVEDVTPQPAAEPEPAVAVEPQPEPEQPREDNGRYAPISALQEERQKRQELERTVAEMRAAQQLKPQPAEQPKVPDPYDDPQGYRQFIQNETREQLLQERFRMSQEMARTQYGAETVDAAKAWAQDRASRDPAFDMALSQQAHPIAWIVQQHKKDGLMAEIGTDPDAYVRRRAAELGIGAVPATPAAPVAVPQSAPAPTPRSLVSAPAAGGAVKDIPTGPMSALDATFK
jgi:hypothetical protein